MKKFELVKQQIFANIFYSQFPHYIYVRIFSKSSKTDEIKKRSNLLLVFYDTMRHRFFLCHFLFPFRGFMQMYPKKPPQMPYYLHLLAGNTLLRTTPEDIPWIQKQYTSIFKQSIKDVFENHLVGFKVV